MLNHGGYCVVVLKQDSLGQRLCIVTLVLTIYENSSFLHLGSSAIVPDCQLENGIPCSLLFLN